MDVNSFQHIAFCEDDDKVKEAFCSFVGEARRIFLVHGHMSYMSCGAKALIDEYISHLGIDVIDFDDFTENPKKEDVEKGVALWLQGPPDLVVAVGGGSVMDMAKLIRFYADPMIQLVVLPTTAGTGAESTQFAVCYIDGVKHSINHPTILPDKVILYPPFTYMNSRYLTACSGFDALAQAVEAYWNINATEESDEHALQAIKRIYPVLGKDKLTEDDRSMLLLGANDAGRAINITRTTVPHALSYTLTSKYGYPHGHAVALSFPFFLKYNLDGKEEAYRGEDFKEYVTKMKLLRSLLHVGDQPYSVMKAFTHSLGLGFDPNRDFDDLVVSRGLNLERAGNTPIAINEDIILSAVQSIRDN